MEIIKARGGTPYNGLYGEASPIGVPFLPKMEYQRVRGWAAGRSLPVLNVFEYPPGS